MEINYGEYWTSDQEMSAIFHRYFEATAVWGQEIESFVK